MERIAVLVASSPTAPSARRAFDLVRTLAAQGHTVSLGLLEDGVLAGTGNLPAVPLKSCTAVLVLQEDLALRGFAADALPDSCRACSYGDLVHLMMEQSDRTLGVF